MNVALPKPTLFQLSDIKDDAFAARIQDSIKAQIGGIFPEEYWQPMIDAALNDLYYFTVELERESSSQKHRVYSGRATGLEKDDKKTIRTASYEEYLTYLVPFWKYLEPCTVTVTKKNDCGYEIYVTRMNDKGEEERVPDTEELTDTFRWRVKSRKPSKFMEIVAAEVAKQANETLVKLVQEYFKPDTQGSSQSLDGKWGPRSNPTELLREKIEKQMPNLLSTFFSDLVANQMSNFALMLLNNKQNLMNLRL